MRGESQRATLFMFYRGALLLFLALLAASAPGEEKKSISMTIAFGDGVEKRFTALPWTEGMTVGNALVLAQEHRRGIQVKSRGKGATQLVTEIDGLANGTQDRYWIFDVNGKEADCSCGVTKLNAGDAVLWRFGTYP